MLVRCEDCNGTGYNQGRCFTCDGSGSRPVAERDFDGRLVRIIETGFQGTANVFGERTIIVINDAEEEMEVTSIEEIQLCEC